MQRNDHLKSDQSHTILRNIALYSSSNIYRRIIGILNAIIKPKLLTPEMFGLWSLLDLFIGYASYLHLGSQELMRYKIPYYESSRNTKQSNLVRGSVFYGSFAICLFSSIGIFLCAIFVSNETPTRVGLVVVAIVIMLQWYMEHYLTLLKAYGEFRVVSYSAFLRANITVFLGIILLYFLNIYGAYITLVLSHLLSIIYLRAKYPIQSYGNFHISTFVNLIRDGFPVMIFNFFTLLIRSVDRIIVISFLGLTQMGYYGITVLLLSFLLQVPGASREVLEPLLMKQMNNKSSEDLLVEYVFRPMINTAYYLPYILGGVIMVLPVFVPLVLPNYIPGITAAQIVVLGGYFLSLAYLLRGVIVANNWQFRAIQCMVISLIVEIGLSLLFLRLGMGLEGVALSCGLSFLSLLVCLFCVILSNYKNTLKWTTYIMPLIWPFLLTCLFVFAFHYISKISSLNPYIFTGLSVLIYYVFMTILIAVARKRCPLLSKFKLAEIL